MPETFGGRIRELRIRRQLSMNEAAKLSGVSVTYWSDVEHDRRPPFSSEKLRKVAGVLEEERKELEAYANQVRRKVEFSLDNYTPERRDLIVEFAKHLDDLDGGNIAAIKNLLQGDSHGVPR